ncbi:MAG: cyclic nucleotide-binding domain-containing protein [Myxococcales bacterium]|nr:cyclic nucleotide-binding domain-containing protein [Myxococcales bacterium]
MTREEVWENIAAYLRGEFGKLLEVRDVRRVRRVAGDAWAVTVVLAAPSGDIHVADLHVDEEGVIRPLLGPDDIVTAVRTADERQRASLTAPAVIPELAGFTVDDSGGGDDDDDVGLSALESTEDLADRAGALVKAGDPASLQKARELLPHLLSDPMHRGETLLRMAKVERALGETKLATNYAEAAAREFGDRFDLPSLEDAAALALELLGKEAFPGSRIYTLLEQCRMRLRPLANLFDCRSLSDLGDDHRRELSAATTLRTLGPGEILVVEGDPSENIFIVKSGLIGVYLEKPSGGSWLVRCCFPGWLLGESSVLAIDPHCTATLRAERVSEVWTLPAPAVKGLMGKDTVFADRIAATKQIHRIDSFFSMHESMAQLDVQVRDEMLSCIQRLESFSEETILLPANEIPAVALLVARGEVALYPEGDAGAQPLTLAPDTFFGVRDSLHQIPLSVTVVARSGSTVAFFDGERLRALCTRSPENVAAVLERLG